MRIECAGSFLVENIQKVMVFFRDGGEINRCIGDHRVGVCSHLREGKLEDFSAVYPVHASECSCVDKGDFWCFEFQSYFMVIRDQCCQRGGGLQGRDIGDELSTCRVVLNKILPSTQSINRL